MCGWEITTISSPPPDPYGYKWDMRSQSEKWLHLVPYYFPGYSDVYCIPPYTWLWLHQVAIQGLTRFPSLSEGRETCLKPLKSFQIYKCAYRE
jgi:hypothetical protein